MITIENINFENWEPHHPETWDYRYAELTEDKVGQFNQKILLPKGTLVKINMVSRFGDVGITTNFHEPHGYMVRVWPSSLTNFKKVEEIDVS